MAGKIKLLRRAVFHICKHLFHSCGQIGFSKLAFQNVLHKVRALAEGVKGLTLSAEHQNIFVTTAFIHILESRVMGGVHHIIIFAALALVELIAVFNAFIVVGVG